MHGITKILQNGLKVVSKTVRSGSTPNVKCSTTILDVFKPNGELLVRRFKRVSADSLSEIVKYTSDFYPISQKGVKEFLAGNKPYDASKIESINIWKEVKRMFGGNKYIRSHVNTPYTQNSNHYYDLLIDKSRDVLCGGIDGRAFATPKYFKKG